MKVWWSMTLVNGTWLALWRQKRSAPGQGSLAFDSRFPIPYSRVVFTPWLHLAMAAASRSSPGCGHPSPARGPRSRTISAIDLGKACVAELIQRTSLDGRDVEALVFGTVVPSVLAPNIAREVALLPMLPKGVQAVTVSRACASANQAITDAADQIALGHVSVAIAGGAESLSNVPILHSRGFSDALVSASRAKTLGGRVKALSRIRPKDLVPITPAIAEPSTGETMGQSAEKMAKINHVSRDEQDQFALRSHRLAAAGTKDGRLTAEIAPTYVPPKYETGASGPTTGFATIRASSSSRRSSRCSIDGTER